MEVIDLRSLRPLDRDTIVASVRKTGCAVIGEDDWLTYGIGAEIAASISDGAFDYLDAPVRRVAMAEVPLPYAKPLEKLALPSAESLYTAVTETLAAVSRSGAETRNRTDAIMPEIVMPRLSDTMEDGVVSAWLKQVGDQITRGEIVAEIETDKALMELEAYDDGVLEKILAEPGVRVPIGEPIAIVGDGTTSTAAPTDPKSVAVTPSTAPTAAPQPGAHAGLRRTGVVKSSPLARKIAREMRVDIDAVVGTGPGGRITKRDVEAAHSAVTTAPAEIVTPSRDASVAAVQPVPASGSSRRLR